MQEKFRFSKGRQQVEVVADEVSQASGLDIGIILEKIPDLTKQHLSAGALWTSSRFGEHPVGVENCLRSQGWIEVKFPSLKVDGSVINDMSEVMRSHAINVHTGEIHSFEEFEGSDLWLSEHLEYVQSTDLIL